jgi:kynureninase
MSFNNILHESQHLDEVDPLKNYKKEFIIPKDKNANPVVYLAGNSLGLQPRKATEYVQEALSDWGNLGVQGYLQGPRAWVNYHDLVVESLAKIVGAKCNEVVAMNSLTVNLHLLMVSFYKPAAKRKKILMEAGAFPSDQYAIKSQLQFHGLDIHENLIEVAPLKGADTISLDHLIDCIKEAGDELALVLIGNVNYKSGQCFDIASITDAAHSVGAVVGFDLAHGVGNLVLNLHEDDVDFAVWCSYKYLNGGPATVGGAFIHEKHSKNFSGPRFEGWWGNNRSTRFIMRDTIEAIDGAGAWQLSNAPIFQMAALRASLELFDSVGMKALKLKADLLTKFLEKILCEYKNVKLITPISLNERGAQLSIKVETNARELVEKFSQVGVISDFREPNIVRLTPAPFYTSFSDLLRLANPTLCA